ncbi:MAG TPA: hypothetical protein VL172_10885 [Kofleriaceae bacterium]|nr:hypothetical protein [Kofleriaceae bacterium]
MGTRRVVHLVALLGACGGGGASPDAAPPDGMADAIPTVAITGRVLDWVNRQPQAGVTVTVMDHPEIEAVTTGADGRYRVVVPAGSQAQLRCEKEAYVPLLTRVFNVGDVDYATYDGSLFDAMASRDAVDLTGDVVGEPYDPAKGGVVLRIQDTDSNDAVAGATVALSLTGHTPLYFNASEFPDPSLTETSTSGLVVLHNYDLGTGTLTVSHATLTDCAAVGPDYDLPPLPLDVTNYADTTTWIPIQCGPPP